MSHLDATSLCCRIHRQCITSYVSQLLWYWIENGGVVNYDNLLVHCICWDFSHLYYSCNGCHWQCTPSYFGRFLWYCFQHRGVFKSFFYWEIVSVKNPPIDPPYAIGAVDNIITPLSLYFFVASYYCAVAGLFFHVKLWCTQE